MKCIISCNCNAVKNKPLIRVFEARDVSIDVIREEITISFDRYVRYCFSYSDVDIADIIDRFDAPVFNALDLTLLYQTGYEG